jgi:ElaB/YqjD/DUF883 family membrane-anchored ribosome-binding protein
MDKNNYENAGQEATGEPGDSGAKKKSTLEHGAEAFDHAQQKVSDAYDQTSEKVGENYNKAKSYIHDNPGKALLITLGIGVGIGLLLGGSTQRTRTGRLAQPVVHALSDIALAFFR